MPDDRPLSTGDVARLLHVTPVCVLRWIRAGKLPAYRVPGGHFRIARFAFRRFLSDNRIPLTLESSPAKRILVVADEHSVQTVFGTALKAKGYDVVLTGSGQEALRLIKRNRFDVIFLDIVLPDGGAATFEAIRKQDPEAVVVLVTKNPDHDETLAALEHGPAMILQKPIKTSDLEAVFGIVFKA